MRAYLLCWNRSTSRCGSGRNHVLDENITFKATGSRNLLGKLSAITTRALLALPLEMLTISDGRPGVYEEPRLTFKQFQPARDSGGERLAAPPHSVPISRASLEEPLACPGVGLEELEQLLGHLPAAGFAWMHVIVGAHVLQSPDKAVCFAWPVAAGPQVRTPQGHRRLDLAARRVVV